MSVIICPGIHSSELTESFLAGLRGQLSDALIFPADQYPAYSSLHILNFLCRQLSNPVHEDPALHQVLQVPLVFLSFSAGVVGAIGAAHLWQMMGGVVKAFIALDGWGVPLYANFPIHRLSHDYFTYWSSNLLGSGEDGFYADPPVAHLDLWRSPHLVQGWWLQCPVSPFASSPCRGKNRTSSTIAQLLLTLLSRYGEGSSLSAYGA